MTGARAPEAGRAGERPALVWRLTEPMLSVSSAPVGGGIGLRHWVLNAEVPSDYARTDIDAHCTEIARANACRHEGVAMLTAASVERVACGTDGGVHAYATVGLGSPTWAADTDGSISDWRPGTINVVAFLPAPLGAAALVNTVITVTEAKVQALIDAGVPATGTASDAVCVLCPANGAPVEPFGGPRSRWGAPLARAVHAAVRAGIDGWRR